MRLMRAGKESSLDIHDREHVHVHLQDKEKFSFRLFPFSVY